MRKFSQAALAEAILGILAFFGLLVLASLYLPRDERRSFRYEVDTTVKQYARPTLDHLLHLARPYLAQDQIAGFQEDVLSIVQATREQSLHCRELALDIQDTAQNSLAAERGDVRLEMITLVVRAYLDMANFQDLNENDPISWKGEMPRQRREQFRTAKLEFEKVFKKSKSMFPTNAKE